MRNAANSDERRYGVCSGVQGQLNVHTFNKDSIYKKRNLKKTTTIQLMPSLEGNLKKKFTVEVKLLNLY